MDSLQERSERLAQTRFLGGPKRDFERVGRMGLEMLLAEGLTPSSRVLDVGCGALRLGYWLMRFLDPGCYFGIEPQQEMLAMGLEQIVEPEVVQRAESRFASNDDFDFSVFDERFDFVVARSIWTHASRAQISKMLASFAETSSPTGVFMASYYPAGAWFEVGHRWPRLYPIVIKLPLAELSPLLARLPALASTREYLGEGWVGRSHECNDPGVVKHSLPWIAGEARRHGLEVQLMPYPIVNHQYWLRVRRAGADAPRP
jgi:SAM-dependent methyltransferase